MDDTTPMPVARRAYRTSDEAWLGGVASGVAEHLGLPALWVRMGFVAACAVGGLGIWVYAGLWMVLPAKPHFADSAPGLAAAGRQGRRPELLQRLTDAGPLVAVGAIVVGVVVLLALVTGSLSVVGPLLVAVGGVGVLWRQADMAQRARWSEEARSRRVGPRELILGEGGWAAYARLVVGLVLVVAAITFVSVGAGGFSGGLSALLAALLGVIGVGFILGPWLARFGADLSEERAERVRSQERADVAAHLHDSVLQTLALIQTSASDPAKVLRLARAQERDLRGWLYDARDVGPATLAAALRGLAGEVEEAHEVTVETVCVGDRRVGEGLRPLLLATREAVVNAAKHSGAGRVDVFAETGSTGTEVFVRDRGRGFDPALVGADRHGIEDSIVGRMTRHGGQASVRSTPGQGTEVRLWQPAGPEADVGGVQAP